jgi:hypothetical protein
MARPPRTKTWRVRKNIRAVLNAAEHDRGLVIQWLDEELATPSKTGRPRKDRAALVDTGPATPDGNLRRLELVVDGQVLGVLFCTPDQLAKKNILAGQRGQANPAKPLTKNAAAHQAIATLLGGLWETLSPDQKEALRGNTPKVVATRLLTKLRARSKDA